MGIDFFPGLLITLEDVRIHNRGVDVATAKQAKLGVDSPPLLRNEVRVGMIALEHPRISIERDRAGKFNFEKSETAGGTVMERTHTPLSVWFWAAYLVVSQTPGMSAVQFQRQLGLSRYRRAEREEAGVLIWLTPATRGPPHLMADFAKNARGADTHEVESSAVAPLSA